MNSPVNKHPKNGSPGFLDYLKTWPLFLLPQHFLSALMHWFMRIKSPTFKNWQITAFIKLFKVNMHEALYEDVSSFADFNEFFTRQLKPQARPDITDENELCCPVDGAISEFGDIVDNQLLQAKGHSFDLLELLAGDDALADQFRNGRFATIYLSPRDYHRIHMPVNGTLRSMTHVPGRLFGVNEASVKTIPHLFSRNERVITVFDTPAGSMALILVGAIFVSSIETRWHGVVTPPRHKSAQRWDYSDGESLEKAQEMGRFNMGSTVILLFPQNSISWNKSIAANSTVSMGQLLATLNTI